MSSTNIYLRQYDSEKFSVWSMWKDIHKSLQQAPLWTALALQDVKNRYRRSWIGPFWITLSMLALITGLGPLYGQLFQQPLNEYLAHLALGVIFWGYISSLSIELCSSLHANANLLRSSNLPIGVLIFRVITRAMIILAHNLLAAIAVLIYVRASISGSFLLWVPGFLLVTVAFVFYGYLVSIVAARYRDVESLITILVQMAFFISPIVWKLNQLPEQKRAWFYFNPFAWMLDVMRGPILGGGSEYAWALLGTAALTLCVAATFVYAKYKSRIGYWV
jgi:lipopolysaccharide transport system permease protein